MATQHKPHELATLLPPMKAKDYERLTADIKVNGLLEPITLYEDKILDGIHRDRICDELGIKPKYEPYTGKDPARFVFSKNLSRRHMTNSQVAMAGAELEEHFAKEARKRMAAGGRSKKEGSANRHTLRRRAAEDAAEVTGSSARSIARAKRIKVKRPDLAEKIKSGEMSVSAADGIISADEVREPQPPKQDKKKQKRWSGKRLREVNAEIRENGTSELRQMQKEIAMAVKALEGFDPPELDWDEAIHTELIGFILDDLSELDMWVVSAKSTLASHLTAMKKQALLKTLRIRANDPSSGEWERAKARRAIETLTDKKELSA